MRNEKDFLEVLEYCEQNLYLGDGNPEASILIVGKEISCKEDDIIKKSNGQGLEVGIKKLSLETAKGNVEKWQNGYPRDEIKTYAFKEKRNPTWTNYQKLVGAIIGKNLGKDNYNFLDHCFITELSQILLPKSNFLKDKHLNDSIRFESIKERETLLSMNFFKFPIVIMACGHYPTLDLQKDYGYEFNIQKNFSVKFIEPTKVIHSEEKKYPACWYNVHYNEDYEIVGKNRIVIHTRQLSRIFNPELLSEIAKECREFYVN